MDLTVLAIPVYFGGMGAEAVALRARRSRGDTTAVGYERLDTLTSLAMGVGSLLLPQHLAKIGRYRRPLMAAAAAGAVAGAPAVTAAAGGLVLSTAWAEATTGNRLFRRSGHRRDLGDGAVALAVAVAGWDFVYYWNHRFMHEWRHMWAIHVVHHSSEHYNLSTALRQAWTDVAGTFVPYGALALLGVRPNLILKARGINLLYQFWIHTELIDRLGPLEAVFNTPSHHRAHHGSNRQYLDRNYGSILIVWDRIFGTFEVEDERVVYGLTENIETFNPIRVALHEHVDMLRDVSEAPSWAERIQLMVRSPGWAKRWRKERAQRTATG